MEHELFYPRGAVDAEIFSHRFTRIDTDVRKVSVKAESARREAICVHPWLNLPLIALTHFAHVCNNFTRCKNHWKEKLRW